jgi:hypothetical protein
VDKDAALGEELDFYASGGAPTAVIFMLTTAARHSINNGFGQFTLVDTFGDAPVLGEAIALVIVVAALGALVRGEPDSAYQLALFQVAVARCPCVGQELVNVFGMHDCFLLFVAMC